MHRRARRLPARGSSPPIVGGTVVRHLLGLLLVAHAGAATAATESPAIVRGKTLFAGNPIAGVRVFAYAGAAAGFRGEAQASTTPSAADGSFTLLLAHGTYYLVARGPVPGAAADGAGESLFGYYGGNPLTVGPSDEVSVNLQVVRRVPPTVTPGGDASTARVTGVVLGPAGPVEGAAVHVYADASRQFRGPDLFGPQGAVPGGTDERGSFSFELPPGTYHLVASKRLTGSALGPLRPGDLHGYFDGNPLDAAPGTSVAITLQVVEKLREALTPAMAGKGETGIRGRVRDPSGRVPPGVYAFATTDPSFMIGAMPPHRSPPVGPDGAFFIEIPAGGGTYYVSARSGYGGPPLPGEWHGFHGEGKPAPVVVESNRVTEGIDVVLKRME
jgi:hypothetical protein